MNFQCGLIQRLQISASVACVLNSIGGGGVRPRCFFDPNKCSWRIVYSALLGHAACCRDFRLARFSHESEHADRRVEAAIFEAGFDAEIIFSWKALTLAPMVADGRACHASECFDTLQAAERVDNIVERPERCEWLRRR
ncbi:hypothetical protein WDM22_38640 [Bradyrhizobium septentrionale]|uniref:hypothetical protein n=1 Tax=Bradyrhizobium septentrionale TaxID=1404411 RepID=UPI0030D624C0